VEGGAMTEQLNLFQYPKIEKLRRLIDRPGTPGEGIAAKAALQRIMARLPVVGRTIEHRPCRHCKSEMFLVEPGKGPHAFHLRCAGADCGRGGNWMTRAEADQLEAEHAEALARAS
jgi:hypothetical protein